MEHSALHAFELMGQIIAFGGVLLVLALIRPALQKLGLRAVVQPLEASVARWTFYGILIAAGATLLDLFVDTAETQGKSVFGGVEWDLLARFATATTVGRLELARMLVLILTVVPLKLFRRPNWRLVACGVFAAICLTSAVSHSAARPEGRMVAVFVQIAHVTAAAIWMGILAQLLAARRWVQSAGTGEGLPLLAQIVKRFSPVALTVTSMLGFSGLFMALRLSVDMPAFLASPYGLILLFKMAMLAPAIFAGWTNFRCIRPRLASASLRGGEPKENSVLLGWFVQMLELEVTSGAFVIMIAGILASVSPPGAEGAYRLTMPQVHALWTPRIPAATFIDPSTFYGAAERPLADLQYAEFTHHWSGVMVMALGMFWLIQVLGGRAGKWAGRGWPLMLLPFMGFVAVASDPEIWWLHKIGFKQVVSDPQLLEHQFGAVIIFALAWLGWRDQRKKQSEPPLGYLLPVIFIIGGILLLGHAHSTLTSTDELTNLITFQHVIFGTFIVLAGAFRWFSLRGLCPRRIGNVLWPAMICGLGIFMTFFYREIV